MAEAGATMNDDGTWWVPMPSGIRFQPENPNPEHVLITDIARKLAQQCRYGGGTVDFYSVAEHCVHMSRITPTADELERYAGDFDIESSWEAIRHFQREALLHDRAEWALQDFIRPLKRKAGSWYFALEQHLEVVSARKFNLEYHPPLLVMQYDNRICQDEKLQALTYSLDEVMSRFDSVPAIGIEIKFWKPKKAERKFLKRFFELFPEADEKGWMP